VSSLFDLTGKVAIVTGSTKGIGQGIARRLAEHGANVMVSSRSQADCDAVAADISRECGRDAAVGQAFDLHDLDSVKRLVEVTVRRFGGLDVVVLNAAKTDILGFANDTTPADFQAMLNANIVNNTELALAAHPHFLDRGGGALIFIASISGTGSSVSTSAYSVCKRALFQLVDNFAVEWGPQKIRVNAVAPGLTISEDTRAFWQNPDTKAAFGAAIPMGRWAEPDDMAAACVWLASPGGAMVTGQTVVIDGGLTMRGANQQAADFKALKAAAAAK